MSLADKLLKVTKSEYANKVSDSIFFSREDCEVIETDLFPLNVALSGELHGGFTGGTTIFAAPSKHFKSLFTLIMIKAHQKKYPDSVTILYDSEFGITSDYMESVDLDTTKIVHVPVRSVEGFKAEVTNHLDNIDRTDHVLMVLDSMGQLASNKEMEDATKENAPKDMTRAQAIKSVSRTITSDLVLKDIPLLIVNHVYEEMSMFPKTIMGGGQGLMLMANSVLFIRKSAEKEEIKGEGKKVIGGKFTLVIEKSRFIKEGSKVPIYIYFEKGVKQSHTIFEWGLKHGFITTPTKGFYSIPGDEKKYRKNEIFESDYLRSLINNPEFQVKIEEEYKLSSEEQKLLAEEWNFE